LLAQGTLDAIELPLSVHWGSSDCTPYLWFNQDHKLVKVCIADVKVGRGGTAATDAALRGLQESITAKLGPCQATLWNEQGWHVQDMYVSVGITRNAPHIEVRPWNSISTEDQKSYREQAGHE
jgi:hypothetical protein